MTLKNVHLSYRPARDDDERDNIPAKPSANRILDGEALATEAGNFAHHEGIEWLQFKWLQIIVQSVWR